MATPESSTPLKDDNGIIVAPAPWKLKCRTWMLLTSPLSSNKQGGALFPAGWAAPFQYEALQKGQFLGGPGMVMLVQYAETPVGPYDELMWIAGKFSMAELASEKKKINGNRITRIYVSTKESTANGRRNWNIPKQVAKFNYTHEADGSWDLAVSLRQKISTKPISHSSIFLRIRFQFLPPIPKGPPGYPPEVIESECTDDGQEPKWASLVPDIRGSMYIATFKPKVAVKEGKNAIADGISFPAMDPWRLAVVMEDVRINFGEAEWH
ncbi:hypothetical protein D9757_004131 [Collybiopsis confluens]|uniref:Uncharacterized protein n=1 Tax=Collybiopsis confluens TaxID=2823264 RepID=A0A8H5HUE0_9AGAR|nr:hypothetical protein D9757_004131 [Collybiopsis confluens]